MGTWAALCCYQLILNPPKYVLTPSGWRDPKPLLPVVLYQPSPAGRFAPHRDSSRCFSPVCRNCDVNYKLWRISGRGAELSVWRVFRWRGSALSWVLAVHASCSSMVNSCVICWVVWYVWKICTMSRKSKTNKFPVIFVSCIFRSSLSV